MEKSYSCLISALLLIPVMLLNLVCLYAGNLLIINEMINY